MISDGISVCFKSLTKYSVFYFYFQEWFFLSWLWAWTWKDFCSLSSVRTSYSFENTQKCLCQQHLSEQNSRILVQPQLGVTALWTRCFFQSNVWDWCAWAGDYSLGLTVSVMGVINSTDVIYQISKYSKPSVSLNCLFTLIQMWAQG